MQSKTGVNPSLISLISQTLNLQNTFKPLFFNLLDSKQKTAFEELISTQKNLQVYDHIYSQVEELIKCLHPTIVFLPPSELANAVENKFNGLPKEDYGVWVYYPWAQKLVHLLNEEEFSIVRT